MSYTLDLSGRVALVTGASSGLGRQFARVLSQAGAAVVLASSKLDRLHDLRAELGSQGGDAHVVHMDVTDPVSIRAAVAHAETEVGPIDILVNNAGVGSSQKLIDVTEDNALTQIAFLEIDREVAIALALQRGTHGIFRECLAGVEVEISVGAFSRDNGTAEAQPGKESRCHDPGFHLDPHGNASPCVDTLRGVFRLHRKPCCIAP